MCMTLYATTDSDLAYIRLLRAGYRVCRRRSVGDRTGELLVQTPGDTESERKQVRELVRLSDPAADVFELA